MPATLALGQRAARSRLDDGWPIRGWRLPRRVWRSADKVLSRCNAVRLSSLLGAAGSGSDRARRNGEATVRVPAAERNLPHTDGLVRRCPPCRSGARRRPTARWARPDRCCAASFAGTPPAVPVAAARPTRPVQRTGSAPAETLTLAWQNICASESPKLAEPMSLPSRGAVRGSPTRRPGSLLAGACNDPRACLTRVSQPAEAAARRQRLSPPPPWLKPRRRDFAGCRRPC